MGDGRDSMKDGMYEAYEGPRTVKDMVVYFTHLAKQVIGLDFLSLDRDEARRKGLRQHKPDTRQREPGRQGVEVGENKPGVLYKMNGCTLVGHVSGRRVPGILRFSLEGDTSFDARQVNMSHIIHHFSYVVVLCAIIGGVYTIAGILDSVLLTGHQVVKKIRKKE